MDEELPKELTDFSKRVEGSGPDSMTDLLREIRDLLATLPDEIKQALTEG